ncbi:phage integrase family protein [Pseudomonas helmanticensis]|uniref:Phage integrase family protein n=1 Tax=Pseudomonas helmanticensis TaxID=1471381 RepID=A0A4R7USJ4_9PSED|nr:site-specific integrase [Pseudomonas helmanticensis]TDV37503.1 phage integrase family protein [Pseudomonas helmanticensis]
MHYSIRSYISRSGERFSLLFCPDAPGIPLFYACTFISRHLRENNTHQTQLSALDAIRRLSEWERDRKLSIENKLLSGDFLATNEIDDLAAHVRARRKGKRVEVISSRKFNIYWAYICSYIAWLTDELLPNRNDIHVRNLVDDQAERLKKKVLKRHDSKARRNQRLLDEKFSDFARAKILSLFEQPYQGLVNSHIHLGTRLRNVIMLRILYETGMRRGELLSLKLRNFVEASGGKTAYLVIERNHDDEFDRRANQPVAKTLGRDVPISEDLERQLIYYRVEFRAELNNVDHSSDAFFFCVHRSGRSQGQPLSINGFNSAILNIQKTFSELGKNLHPHAFRHDWNYRFSLHADKMGISEQEESEAREEGMGWVAGSAMAKVYNLRHRREKSMEIGRKVARDTVRPNQS